MNVPLIHRVFWFTVLTTKFINSQWVRNKWKKLQGSYLRVCRSVRRQGNKSKNSSVGSVQLLISMISWRGLSSGNITHTAIHKAIHKGINRAIYRGGNKGIYRGGNRGGNWAGVRISKVRNLMEGFGAELVNICILGNMGRIARDLLAHFCDCLWNWAIVFIFWISEIFPFFIFSSWNEIHVF